MEQGGEEGLIAGEQGQDDQDDTKKDDDQVSVGSDDKESRKNKKKHRSDDDDVVKLEVCIKSASGLRDADWMGQSDPYCICEIPHPTKKKKKKVASQTPVIDDNSNPIWNHAFKCKVKMGATLDFSIYDKDLMQDELLGRCELTHRLYFPFGYKGELRLQDTGEETWAHLKLSVKCLEVPEKTEAAADEKQGGRGLWAGINFEEDNASWMKAHAVVNAMEGDATLQKEETTSTALDTLVRLAESGLPIPSEALARVMACLQSTDRRYRLASLMICKALGQRVVPFAKDLGSALADADEEVRAGACKVLGTLGESAAPYVAEIGSLLHDEVPQVRSAALEALGVLSQADCLQALVVLGTCLDHEDKRYRLACCLILKALQVKATPHAYPLAERIEKDPSLDVRIAACGTLGNIGLGAASVQLALVSLYRAEADPDQRLSGAAKEALQKLREQGHPLPPRPVDLAHLAESPPPPPPSEPPPPASDPSHRSHNDHHHDDQHTRGRGRGRLRKHDSDRSGTSKHSSGRDKGHLHPPSSDRGRGRGGGRGKH